ncbi:hypothetical protein JCM30471_12460 [Desulfuromonas carbonis]|uniref:hypothetical protein n=1 Tax=Desulfuromonas sp. DDH964 TaxID=1823759 RepID=UPI00078C18A7|nr:hypothetical protein [Desulfuromonas sp. DDH964]AMV72730.1 hypothetical protein DBW_2393 [Desulfuromonas sp. DDH964]
MKTEWNLMIPVTLLTLVLAATPLFAAANSTAKTTANDVRQEIGDALQTIGSYSAEQRDAAVAAARQALEKTDARIEQLQKRIDQNWQSMSAEARQQARAAMKELQQERRDIAEWYGGRKHSSSNAWDEIKRGFAKSYDQLGKSLEKAAGEF